MSTDRPIILLTDRIYPKTRRHLEKVRVAAGTDVCLDLAILAGFPSGLEIDHISDLTNDILVGTIDELVDQISRKGALIDVRVVALNQSAILPGIALQRALGVSSRRGYVEACDKRLTRQLLAIEPSRQGMPYAQAIPGEPGSTSGYFEAERYVVKPAFGMSSSDVNIFKSWREAKDYAESSVNATDWVPAHVMKWLSLPDVRTKARLIEPYIDGVEFSVDGWIYEGALHAIVQHKLCMVNTTFIGDGPTISPPLQTVRVNNWMPLAATELEIKAFAQEVLEALGLVDGVFHIEGRQDRFGALHLIEVNPRAPGGSLWKSALLRTGYDLELVDAWIQLGRGVPEPITPVGDYVLHYPYYARNCGVLRDWGELGGLKAAHSRHLTIDFVCSLGAVFTENDLTEEPYLAFAVAHDSTIEGLLATCQTVLNLAPPTIMPA